MIKAVIFDIGGVLLRTHDQGPRRQLEAELELEKGEVERLVFNSEMATRAQSGEISDEEQWQWVGERLALSSAELEAFRERFWAGDVLDSDLSAYIRSLRPDYQTAVLSNATDYAHHALADPILDAFDLVVWSAEEKVMKPDKRIYRLTLTRLGREPEETVFVDDSQANVEAAEELGMHAVHYRAGMDLPAALAALGVQPANKHEQEHSNPSE